MKKRSGIFVAALGIGLLAWFLIWTERVSPQPVLEFQGYGKSTTNNTHFAKLELRNTSKRNIWIILSGEDYPIQPAFLEKPRDDPSTNKNPPSARLVAHYWMEGHLLWPGTSLLLEFPLVPGNPPKQAGVIYYEGHYKDGNDLVDLTMIRRYPFDVNIFKKTKNLLQDLKRKWKVPKPHEVWCSERLSLPAADKTNLVSALR